MTGTREETGEEGRRCVCPSIDAEDCFEARSPMRWPSMEDDTNERESCECGCHYQNDSEDDDGNDHAD